MEKLTSKAKENNNKINVFKYYNGGLYILTANINGKHIERSIMFDKWHNKRNSTIEQEITLFNTHINKLSESK